MPSKFLNISTDNTLGGSSPSDTAVPSQKAIKEYVDNHSGGGGLPSQTGQSGKFLTTDGTDASWSSIPSDSSKADIGFGNIDNSNNTAANNLNSKGIRTVITSYKNGTSWYRIYSDGWVEQGGAFSSSSTEQNKSVNLLKTMADTNYFISLQRIRNAYDATATYSVVRAVGTGSFTCYGLTDSTRWEVKGFGA